MRQFDGEDPYDLNCCAMCHSKALSISKRPIFVYVGDLGFETKVACQVCDECGEFFVQSALLQRVEMGVARTLLSAKGVVSNKAPFGDTLNFVRKTLGLSRETLSLMTGIALPELVSLEKTRTIANEPHLVPKGAQIASVLGFLVDSWWKCNGKDD